VPVRERHCSPGVHDEVAACVLPMSTRRDLQMCLGVSTAAPPGHPRAPLAASGAAVFGVSASGKNIAPAARTSAWRRATKIYDTEAIYHRDNFERSTAPFPAPLPRAPRRSRFLPSAPAAARLATETTAKVAYMINRTSPSLRVWGPWKDRNSIVEMLESDLAPRRCPAIMKPDLNHPAKTAIDRSERTSR
jgi:hypothetical protein